MNDTIWNKRIPTLLGLFLITVGVIATAALVRSGAIPFIGAAPSENPQGIRITNVTDSSFTLTYKTDAVVLGSVSLDGRVVLDDRDQASGIPKTYALHSITVHNLTPSKTYSFSISSGSTTYVNNGSPFTTQTGPTLTASPSQEIPISGRVILPTGNNPAEALIYVTTKGGQTLSTLVKSSGIYVLPLNTMRQSDLVSVIPFTPTTTMQLLVIGPDGTSAINILASKRNPVPTITLSQNYDFTIDTTPLATSSALPIGFPAFALDTSIQASPQIETPTNNETFSDAQPLLQGKALPDATVQITIHSQDVITTTITADSFGNWVYRPTQKLSPGTHTLTITTKDKFGILKTIEQTFTIFQSGTQVAEAATPSATPTLSATPSVTQVPTITPSIFPLQTSTPSPTIFPSPTQPLVITPTPAKKIPPTGENSAVTIGIGGIITVIIGAGLFLLTHGASL